MIYFLLGLFVCLFVSPSLCLVRFGKLLRYADKLIVNIKVYIERNTLQLECIRYRKHVDFIHVYFCEATDPVQYRPPNAYQEVSNTNHFGSVSDSLGWTLGRIAAASQCVASQYTCIFMTLDEL